MLCEICGEKEYSIILGTQKVCQDCYDYFTEQAELESAQKAKDETCLLEEIEFNKQFKSIISESGFKITDSTIAETGTHYYFCEKGDTYLKIRVADHADAYGDSEINVNTPGGNNLDGIDISLLADRLQEF